MNKEIIVVALLFHSLEVNAFENFLFEGIEGYEKDFRLGNDSSFFESRSRVECARTCSFHPQCLGFNFCQTGSPASPDSSHCQLMFQRSRDSLGQMKPAPGCIYRELHVPCVHGSAATVTRQCDCHLGAYGTTCDKVIRDCTEGKEMGMKGENEIARIQPLGIPEPFNTRCDFSLGLTMVIRRLQRCLDRDGFATGTWDSLRGKVGTCSGCCFVGLDALYQLLNQGFRYNLEVSMRYNGGNASIHYPDVQMQNATGRYTLTWGPPSTKSSAAQDGFLPGRNRKFCAPDHDCSGCAADARHAGWFDDSEADCEEAKGLGDPLRWPFNFGLQNLNEIVFEILRV